MNHPAHAGLDDDDADFFISPDRPRRTAKVPGTRLLFGTFLVLYFYTTFATLLLLLPFDLSY